MIFCKGHPSHLARVTGNTEGALDGLEGNEDCNSVSREIAFAVDLPLEASLPPRTILWMVAKSARRSTRSEAQPNDSRSPKVITVANVVVSFHFVRSGFRNYPQQVSILA